MTIPDIREVEDLKDERVLVRASLNTPLQEGVVMDDFRLTRVVPTITYLQERGARVIVMGHIGRDPKETLTPIYEYLNKKIDITFVPEVVGPSVKEAVQQMKGGDVILLENLRRNEGEYVNDPGFTKELSGLADIYVNDAFAASHRNHASIVGVPSHLPSYAGLGFQNEVDHLQEALTPEHPSLFVLAGAKFETKEPLIRKFLDIYDRVFIGGALANDLFEAQGLPVGKSLVSKENPHLEDILNHPNLLLPVDVVVENNENRSVKKPTEVGADDTILDAGPETIVQLSGVAKQSAFILWNGPLGNYEEGFSEHTEKLAKAIASHSGKCIVGGGDTIASIAKLELADKFGFVSTGGGAMLQFLLDGTLPGIVALRGDS